MQISHVKVHIDMYMNPKICFHRALHFNWLWESGLTTHLTQKSIQGWAPTGMQSNYSSMATKNTQVDAAGGYYSRDDRGNISQDCDWQTSNLQSQKTDVCTYTHKEKCMCRYTYGCLMWAPHTYNSNSLHKCYDKGLYQHAYVVISQNICTM
jgi:hypothetical protein